MNKSFSFFKQLCLCTILLLLCPNISAQSVDVTSTQHLDTVEVVAKKRVFTTRHSAPLQILSKSSIESLGIQDMAEAIRRFSGVAVKDYGGIGGLKTVSIRSFGSQHTAVSYDGVSVSNAQNGQIDIGRFSLDNVEELSLTISQSDNIFQTARLFSSAGVINIVNAKPVFKDKPFNLNTKVRFGSFGQINPNIRYEQKLSDRWSFALSADYMTANGEYPFTLTNGKLVTEERRENTDVEYVRAELNVFADFDSKGKLSAKGYYYGSERGLPGSVIFYNKEANERLWDKNGFAQLNYEVSLSDQWALKANAKYNYAWNKYTDIGGAYSGGKIEDRYTQQEYYAAAVAQYSPFEHLSFSLAEDVALNTLESTIKDAANPRRLSSLTALAAKYEDSRLTVTGSLLGTYTKEYVADGQDPAPDRKRLSPAIGASFRILPDRNVRIRASYKDIFRVPTFNDLYYARIGNRSLRPEKAKQLNLGLTWSESYPDWNIEQISLTADAFCNKVEDKIVALPTLFIWKMLNMGEVDIRGLDINFSSRFILPAEMTLQVAASYSYQKAIDKTDPKAKNYEDQIPYTPLHSGTASLSLENKWVNLGYTLTVVGERYVLPQNTPTNKVEGYEEHTVSANRTFDIKQCKLRLQASVVNIFDETYDVIKFYPMPGRSFLFSATFIY